MKERDTRRDPLASLSLAVTAAGSHPGLADRPRRAPGSEGLLRAHPSSRPPNPGPLTTLLGTLIRRQFASTHSSPSRCCWSPALFSLCLLHLLALRGTLIPAVACPRQRRLLLPTRPPPLFASLELLAHTRTIKMVRIVVTGATGTAGSEVLRQALLHPAVSGVRSFFIAVIPSSCLAPAVLTACQHQVTVLSRRPLPPHVEPSPPNDKLKVILHADFTSYPPSLLEQLKGHDGAIWALGKSSVGMSESDYEVITVDYAVAAAKAFSTLKPEGDGSKFVFAYLSGAGTDQREGKASQMFGRVKGAPLEREGRAFDSRPLADLGALTIHRQGGACPR